MSDAAEARLAAGDPRGALEALAERVRARPADVGARVFLFQLLAVNGEWRRAAKQLDVAAGLDDGTRLMAQTCRELLRCELLREAVFEGRRAPLVLGEPPEWLAPLVRALPLAASGDGGGAAALAAEAFERAAARGGRLTLASDESGETLPFEWIGDADMRLGPVLEVIIDGKYYWVPFERIDALEIEPPADLRDLVWTPVELVLAGGGSRVGFVPTRYPEIGPVDVPDPPSPEHLLARRSDWLDLGGGYFVGRGQRVLASSAGEHALLECRSLRLAGTDGGMAGDASEGPSDGPSDVTSGATSDDAGGAADDGGGSTPRR